MLSFASWLVALVLLSMPCHSGSAKSLECKEAWCPGGEWTDVAYRKYCRTSKADLGLTKEQLCSEASPPPTQSDHEWKEDGDMDEFCRFSSQDLQEEDCTGIYQENSCESAYHTFIDHITDELQSDSCNTDVRYWEGVTYGDYLGNLGCCSTIPAIPFCDQAAREAEVRAEPQCANAVATDFEDVKSFCTCWEAFSDEFKNEHYQCMWSDVDLRTALVSNNRLCNEERPHFHLNITFNEMVGSNGEDAFDTHFDAIIEVLSNYLDCDKKAIDITTLSYAGLSVKARFAISGKSEKEVVHVIDDILHSIKLPLKFVLNGVPVLSVDTVYKSWADATEISTDSELTTDEPSTTEPMDEFPYFHLNFTFNEEAGFNGAEAYKSHRDAIQTVLSEYLECNKTAINATFITHMQMSAEVKFVITGMSERRVAKKIDDTWHDLKLPLKFVLKGVPVVWVDTVHTSWERDIYDSSSALLTGFMASCLVLCIFF